MTNTFLLKIFAALDKNDQRRLRKFLQSPYHNQRTDVVDLFDYLVENQKSGTAAPTREAAWAKISPEAPFEHLQLNHVATWLTALIEEYLTLEEIQANRSVMRLHQLRALRKRNLTQQFERDAQLFEKELLAEPKRDAGHFLAQYHLQEERFAFSARNARNAHADLPGIMEALANFFQLESLRWMCLAQSAKVFNAEQYNPPFAETVLETCSKLDPAQNPAAALFYESLMTLQEKEDPAHFIRLKGLIGEYIQVLPPAAGRDVYMSAINFAIRRHNQGDKAYTREAFQLYREALERNVLPENGFLPKYTFINIHNLAHLAGETAWALHFLEHYPALLPAADRDNIYQYCLAGFHFRQKEYGLVLELLAQVDFTEPFIQLDARKMMLRSYFERGEWLALASLLESFTAYLRRQKDIGYHREGYLNLIRFTKKIAQPGGVPAAKAKKLAEKIRAAGVVTEREWLLGKL